MSVAFLFGAGAEGKGNFELPSGIEFMQDVFFGESYLMTNALREYFNGNYFEKNSARYKYSCDRLSVERAIFKSSLSYFIENSPNAQTELAPYQELIKDEFLVSELKFWGLADAYKNNSDDNKNVDKPAVKKDEIIQEIKEIYTTEGYIPKSDLLKLIFSDSNKYIGLGGALDSQFHTLINPLKYGKVKFSRVFNYYWSCYFSIIKGILDFFKSHGSHPKIYDFYDGGNLNYNYILSNIIELTKFIYQYDYKLPKQTYYYNIRNYLLENVECSGIITTNYFNFCEKIFSDENLNDDQISRKIAYINGKLNWFEFPELLEIRDFIGRDVSSNSNELFFPFIFGQSTVKPIVHPLQTQEYNKADCILENTDTLVILGFNLNDDDNHLNALLHKFLQNDNSRIIVCHSNKEKPENAVKTASDKLKYNGTNKIISCPLNYNGDNSKNIEEISEIIDQE